MTPGEFEAALEGKREDDKRQRIERRNAVIAILVGLSEKTTVQKLTDLIVGKDPGTEEDDAVDEIMAISEERAYRESLKSPEQRERERQEKAARRKARRNGVHR